MTDSNFLFPKKLTEQLLYSTVRIEGRIEGQTKSVGTGFLFNVDLIDNQKISLILTNKHVIGTFPSLFFILHEGIFTDSQIQPNGKHIHIALEIIPNSLFPHPDAKVDLCAILFSPIENHAKNKLNKSIYYKTFDKSLIKTDDELQEKTSVADSMLMVGYPTGLWDTHNNFPIIRKGIAASHPATNFNNQNIGVVDIGCFPGSSGSPILIYEENAIRQLGRSISFGTRAILLGLLYAGPTYNCEGKIIIKEIPTQFEPVVPFTQMMHLGYYIKSKEILTLCALVLEKCNLKPK